MGGRATGPALRDAWQPRRTGEWEQDTFVTLIVPRFGTGRFGQVMDRWLGFRPHRIRLDEIGTFVWERMDGQRTFDEIARDMRTTFGDRVEPAEERLTLFLGRLRRARALGA